MGVPKMKWKLIKLFFWVGIWAMCLIIDTTFADLVAYYSFDRKDSRIIVDISGKGHDGLAIGNLKWITSRIGFGNALYFTGINRTGFVNCGIWNPSEITGQLTISLWIRWDEGVEDWQGVVSKRYRWAADQMMWQIGIDKKTQKIGIYQRDKYANCGNYILPKGKWTCVAFTFDGTSVVFYVNGERMGKDSFLFGSKTNSSIIIGAANPEGEDAFHGAIDEVFIFDDALEQQQIRKLYSLGAESLLPRTYMDELVEHAETMVKYLKPEEVIGLLETKIVCEKRLPSDIFYLLAKSKNAANIPVQDIITAYKKSILLPQRHSKYLPDALFLLFEKMPTDEYINIVEMCIRNSDDLFYDIHYIAKHFMSVGNWTAFKVFLDGLFSVIDLRGQSTYPYVKIISEALDKDVIWANRFVEYCMDKPELTEYVFHEQEAEAEKYIEKKDFQRSIEIYRDIIKQCKLKKIKNKYELKIFECQFKNGQYEVITQEIDSFIEDLATDRVLIGKAIMLKGRSYINLGDMDRAIDVFLMLMFEYPETEMVSASNFFVGYCYMLQGQFTEATDAFNLVLHGYPESEYVDNARSYLARIVSMSE